MALVISGHGAGVCPPIEWATAGRPIAGEQRSGDRAVVTCGPDGVLLAVVDGAGHGDEAARAADTACAVLAAAGRATLPELVERCHAALIRTRGAVLNLARVAPEGAVEWLGVGNVEGAVLRAGLGSAAEGLVVRGGVVGYRLPSLQPSRLQLRPGDVLVIATDGLRSSFLSDLRSEPPLSLAGRLLRDHSRDSDDALVLVARVLDVRTGPPA